MSASPIVRLPCADVSAGQRFEAMARQAVALAQDVNLPTSTRLQFFREAERFETLAALHDAEAILAQHAEEIA